MLRCPRSKWTLLPHHKMNYHNKLGDAKGNDQPRFPGELPRHRPHWWENYSDDHHVDSKILTHTALKNAAHWLHTHSCKDVLFIARSNKSRQKNQLDLSIFHIRLVSLRPLCLPLWASSCGCPKVFTLVPSVNIILIIWDMIFMIVIVAVLMITSIFIWILKYHPVSA